MTCYLPKYWNHSTLSCESCPSGQNYDISVKKCVVCPAGHIFNTTTYVCSLIATTSSNSTTVTTTTTVTSCGSGHFWNGQTCIACYLPKYWNHTSLSCESCPSGQNYDVSIKRCTTCQVGQFFNFTSYTCAWGASVSGTGSATSTTTTTTTSTSNAGTCSAGQFWNGNTCIWCYLPKYWNHSTLACESCPSGQNYDVNVKKCVVCGAGQVFNFTTYTCSWVATTNANINTGSSTTNTVTVTNTNTGTTAGTTSSGCTNGQFWNGNSCVSCYLPNYWNHNTLGCESCPSGQNYDISVKKCLTCANYSKVTYTCV